MYPCLLFSYQSDSYMYISKRVYCFCRVSSFVFGMRTMANVHLTTQTVITREPSGVWVPGYRCIPALVFNISMAYDAAIHTVASLKCFPLIPGNMQASDSSCPSTHLYQFSLSLPLHVLNNPSSPIICLAFYSPIYNHPPIHPTIQQALSLTHTPTHTEREREQAGS